ncbi:MAG: hypothetical protein C0507_03735 [Cyanobacteria bacterium PR.3.49]|nr:hypothetical protein [Cyanobacteria bacterium PR.3.49]
MMSQIGGFYNMPDEIQSTNSADNEPVIAGALSIINSLVGDGIVKKYAVGGSIALLNYVEPFVTEDLDIFCHIEETGTLISLSPIYSHLKSLGFQSDGEFISIDGVLVQFLVPPSKLVEEALNNSVIVNIETVDVPVFDYEYLLAVLVETNRPKDRLKLELARESRDPDEGKLMDILERYNLVERWKSIIA